VTSGRFNNENFTGVATRARRRGGGFGERAPTGGAQLATTVAWKR
jgi:hypothetical protein